ncbi:MAG: hypothetical protein JNK04_15005 [Myxococcales bacterium]|nr:hypothetical protein [Myxococcales bacterium]
MSTFEDNCYGRFCTASESYKAAEAERQQQAARFAGQAERCGVGASSAVGRMVDTGLSLVQTIYWVGEHALTGSVSEPFVGYDVLHRGSGHMTQGADGLQFMFENPPAAAVEAGKALVNPTAEGLCDAAVSAAVPAGSARMLKSRGKLAHSGSGTFVKKRKRTYDSKHASVDENRRFLDEMEEGDTASWVYDDSEGRLVMKQSQNAGQEYVDGMVPRNHGHEVVLDEGWPGEGRLAVLRQRDVWQDRFYAGTIRKMPDGSFSWAGRSGLNTFGTSSAAGLSDAVLGGIKSKFPF